MEIGSVSTQMLLTLKTGLSTIKQILVMLILTSSQQEEEVISAFSLKTLQMKLLPNITQQSLDSQLSHHNGLLDSIKVDGVTKTLHN